MARYARKIVSVLCSAALIGSVAYSAAAESDLASDISERVSPENRSDAEEVPADSEHSVADDPESLPDDTDKGKEADGE